MVGNRYVILVCSVTGLFLIGCKPVGSPSRGTVDTGRGVKVELKVATCQPTNLPGLGDAILGVAERVHEMTAGRIEMDVQEPGAIVPALEVLDAVSSGTVGGGSVRPVSGLENASRTIIQCHSVWAGGR